MTKNNEQLKDEALARATRFEQMTLSEGWKEVVDFVQEKITAFSNTAINEGFKDMETYQLERGKVLGLTALLAEVATAIDLLKKEREKSNAGAGEPAGDTAEY